VLRNVALRGADGINNVLHADFVITQHAENFQAQGVRHGFERVRGAVYIFAARGQGRQDDLGWGIVHGGHMSLLEYSDVTC